MYSCIVVEKQNITGRNPRTGRYRNGTRVTIKLYVPEMDDYIRDTIWVNASIFPPEEIVVGASYLFSMAERRFVNYFEREPDPLSYGELVEPGKPVGEWS